MGCRCTRVHTLLRKTCVCKLLKSDIPSDLLLDVDLPHPPVVEEDRKEHGAKAEQGDGHTCSHLRHGGLGGQGGHGGQGEQDGQIRHGGHGVQGGYGGWGEYGGHGRHRRHV